VIAAGYDAGSEMALAAQRDAATAGFDLEMADYVGHPLV
jgi:hypothetical protein